MGRKGRANRRNLDFLRDVLGAALHDSDVDVLKENIQLALAVLEVLPGGTRAAPKWVRRANAEWDAVPKKRPRRPERF